MMDVVEFLTPLLPLLYFVNVMRSLYSKSRLDKITSTPLSIATFFFRLEMYFTEERVVGGIIKIGLLGRVFLFNNICCHIFEFFQSP